MRRSGRLGVSGAFSQNSSQVSADEGGETKPSSVTKLEREIQVGVTKSWVRLFKT